MGTKTSAWLLGIGGKAWKLISLRAPAILLIAACGAALLSVHVPARAEVDKLVHNSNTVGTKYGTWGAEYTCATCHNRLAVNNAKYVNDTINTPIGPRPVIFDRYTASSNDITGVFGNDERTTFVNASRNVCEVCHHQTIYHNYSATKIAGLSLDHPEHRSNKKDCNACHKHKYGYRPPQQGACVDCHGTPPVQPSDLASNALGANPPADAGAHNRHRNIEGMECHTCHNNFGHGLLGNSMIEIGFRIDKRTWSGFSGISTVMSGTFTGTIGDGFNNNYAVAPKNPGTQLLRVAGVTSCSIYCHGDNWAVPSGRVGSGVSWVQGPLGDCSNAACHGTTPANPPNPGVPGAHQTHVGTLQQACTKCHDNYSSPHMINGRVAWNLAGQGATATYKGFQVHSTAALPGVTPYGSCDGIYCHSNIQGAAGTGGPTQYQPVPWGSTTILACDGCHGGKKSDAAPIATGAHTKHIGSYSCGECHFGAGADGSIMNHLNSNIEVALGSSGGGYDQMPVNTPGNGYGNCSANYCHSDGRGATVSVSWSAGPLSCTACHKGDQPGNAIASGKHTAHVDNAGFLGSNFVCIDCHASTVSSNTAISNPDRHANRMVDYSGARAGSYAPATGLCSASYCHSDGKGGAPAVTVAWNDGSVINDCKGCHGNAPGGTFTSVAGEPNYPNEGVDLLRANSHERHMGGVGGTTCVYCHNNTMEATGMLKAGTLHLNSSRDVAPGGGKGFAYDPGTRSCANVTCHGGPSAVRWGSTFAVDCTGCHGNNALSFAPISSGKHKAHINNKTVLGRNFACAACHALTARSDDRGIADTTVHGNGFKNYTGVMAGGRSSYSTITGVCSASYCHSDGKGEQKDLTVAGWKSAATIGCTGCHGSSATPDFASTAGEPNYASSGPGSLRANDHKNHVDFGVLTCTNCHAETVDAAGAILQNVSSHVNRRIDVMPGGGKSFTFAAADKSCSDISCHGGKGSFTQIWGTPVKADCTGCHGNNSASSAPIVSGRHTAHVNNPDLGGNFNCAECHAGTINPDERSFANRTLHGNGFLDYSGVRAGGSTTYDPATGACSATYCHTDGKGRQNVPFDLANGWKSSVTYGNCKGCHGNDSAGTFTAVAGEPNYPNEGIDLPRANSHERHMGGTGGTTCIYCHNDTMDATGALKAGTLHLNKFRDVAGGGGKTFTYDSATKSCSNITCHGGPAAVKWGASFPVDCTGCHGNNAFSFAPISSGKHKAHMNNKAVLGRNFSCATCHALTARPDDRGIADTSVHGNGFKNYTGQMAGGRSSYSSASGICSASYCHSDGKGEQKDLTLSGWKSTATLECTGCHGSSATPDFASSAGEPNYASTGPGTLRANDHKNHVDFGALTCTNCHGDTVDAAGALKQDINSHLNRNIDVIPGGGKSFSFNPADKSCSDISCHGGKGSFTQVWGTPVKADCTGCHGNNAASSAPISSGRHTAHVNNPDLGGNFNCTECHAGTINSDERSFANRTLHGNGFLDYSGVRAGRSTTYDAATGACSATYCHTDGKGTQNVPFNLANGWKSSTTYANCIGCHGNAGAADFVSIAGEPNYASTGANQLRSNSHKLHVGTAGAATCTYCHSSTVNVDGTAITGNHTNRAISYESSAIAGKTFTPGSGKSCSNIACHGSGSPAATWGDNLGCTGCHGGNAGNSPIITGTHAAHINNAAQIGINLGCAECHAPVVSGDTSFSNRNKHADGFVNFSGARTGRNAAVCNAAYCHSDGKGGPGAAVVWGSTPPFTNCVGCHGVAVSPAFASQAGEPNYASQAGLLANSHLAHTTKLADKGAASCTICHVSTVTPAGTAVSASGLHLNGQIEVSFNTAKAGASAFYNPDKTCSGTSCHGSGNPKWGDAASAGCLTCHSTLPGSHAAHLGTLWSSGGVTFYNFTANRSAGSSYRYGCANCHPTDELRHRNGQVDIDLSWNKSGNGSLNKLNKLVTTAGTGYTKNGTTSFTCDTVYCHSDGRDKDNPTYKSSPNWYVAFSGNRCGMCHDNPPRYAGQSHYVDQSSMGNNGKPPYMENGHMVGIHFKIISKGGTQNGFLGFSSSGSAAHGNAGLATTVSCVTCHSGIVGATRIDTYAMDGTSSLFRCSSCHTATSRTPLQSGEIANTALHINGTKDVLFAPVTFKTKAQLANVANALGWTRNGSYKADDSYDSFNLGVSTWDAQTRTCLTACHVNQPNITWGAQLQCFSCHANQ